MLALTRALSSSTAARAPAVPAGVSSPVVPLVPLGVARPALVPRCASSALMNASPLPGMLGRRARPLDVGRCRRLSSSAGGPVSTPIGAIEETETVVGAAESHEFRAETRKLLDIVARSLYTDREVFVRELISNASDALEKLRHVSATGGTVDEAYLPTEIHIYADPAARTLTIQDYGIGMTRQELIDNLGMIASSGSLKFLNQLKEGGTPNTDIIGQFGVGFYSAFMVADKVKVYSRSAAVGSKGFCWTSDGTGAYTIAEADGVLRGSKIILHLKEDAAEFSQKQAVENIIKKYSNFVGFPIKVNGAVANTVKPLWLMSKREVSEDQHKQFYQFIANAFDQPLYTLHYQTDSPIQLRSLFYVPERHLEKYGMGRQEPGVSLYCRRVLIQAKAKGLLPEWLRFIKGVVDSEDIPLNLSREHLQDSALIARVSNVVTRKILLNLVDEMRADRPKYEKFWKEFGTFLKEGVLTDVKWKDDLAKLLLQESSGAASEVLVSLDEYVGRMGADQKDIYYLAVPSRALAESSPYYETFKARKLEVLFLYNQVDEFVMTNLGEYKGKTLVSIESASVDDLPKTAEASSPSDGAAADTAATSKLGADELRALIDWLKSDALADRVLSVRDTDRLTSTPAIVVDHESATVRKMMKFMDPTQAAAAMPKPNLEINPKHPLVIALARARSADEATAKLVATQMFDNALIAAGLMDDARPILTRMTEIMSRALKQQEQK